MKETLTCVRMQPSQVSMTARKAKKKLLIVDEIMEFFGCDPSQLENVNLIVRILVRAAKLAGMKVVGVKKYKFSPQGFTAVVLLAQSHIAIHTYPEDKYAIIDILACDPKDLPRGCKYLEESICCSTVQSKTRMIERSFEKNHTENVRNCARKGGERGFD